MLDEEEYPSTTNYLKGNRKYDSTTRMLTLTKKEYVKDEIQFEVKDFDGDAFEFVETAIEQSFTYEKSKANRVTRNRKTKEAFSKRSLFNDLLGKLLPFNLTKHPHLQTDYYKVKHRNHQPSITLHDYLVLQYPRLS